MEMSAYKGYHMYAAVNTSFCVMNQKHLGSPNLVLNQTALGCILDQKVNVQSSTAQSAPVSSYTVTAVY